jgi:carbon monoxide dehydrogenase subunit G
MRMSGEQRIAAPRLRVWEALNDPEILRQCVPGCQSLTKESDTRLTATVEIKIGPIGARFIGAVTLSDLNPPHGYTITGEGQAGVVGSAKGGAKVILADDGAGTLLTYEVEAQVSGRLAQLGGPIIDATAKQLAGKFFARFGELVGGVAPARAPAKTAAKASAAAPAYAQASPGGLPMAWILAVALAAIAGFLLGKNQGSAGSDWAGLAIGLLTVIVAAAGVEFGRRNAAPVIMLDPALLVRLAESAKQ